MTLLQGTNRLQGKLDGVWGVDRSSHPEIGLDIDPLEIGKLKDHSPFESITGIGCQEIWMTTATGSDPGGDPFVHKDLG
jgi:hypothetical protein